MTLYNEINENLTKARKAKDSFSVTLHSTIKGELGRISDGKPENLSDDQIIKKIRGMLESAEVTLELFKSGGGFDIEPIETELDILNSYLPKMMSDQEIKDCIDAFVYQLGENPKPQDIGKVMKSLKQFSSVMDMKFASTYAKTLL